MITYLHHTTPDLPHYRGKEWNFQRGAAATVDRPFLGWQGRFFLHDVAHFHVVHHVRALFFAYPIYCREVDANSRSSLVLPEDALVYVYRFLMRGGKRCS